MKKKSNNIKFCIMNLLHKKLNKFCFSDNHGNDCSGCIFSISKKCLVVEMDNKLLLKMKNM